MVYVEKMITDLRLKSCTMEQINVSERSPQEMGVWIKPTYLHNWLVRESNDYGWKCLGGVGENLSKREERILE